MTYMQRLNGAENRSCSSQAASPGLTDPIEPLPLDQRQHDQRLTIRHWSDRDVLVELEAVAHARSKRHVGDLAVRLHLRNDALQR